MTEVKNHKYFLLVWSANAASDKYDFKLKLQSKHW